jgi:large repetitive protein
LPVARSMPAVALGAGGRIFVSGGTIGSTYTNSVDVFDPASGGWSSAPPMNVNRSEHAAATDVHGTIYVMGGWNGAALNSAERLATT